MIGQTNSIVSNNTVDINEFFVKVIDYDGSIIDERYMHNGEIYTLPQVPEHKDLVFQEWSCSQEIINNQIIIDNNNVMVGPIYTTVSGQNEFDIELAPTIGKSVTLNITGIKDWGDGTINTDTSHTYSDYGEYTIMCNGTSKSSGSGGYFGQNSGSINYYVKSIKLATFTQFNSSNSFEYCYSLKSITMSNSVTVLNCIFNHCFSLENIIIPNSVTSIGSSIFYYCYNLKNIVIPNSVINIEQQLFYKCYTLINAILPNSVSTINARIFYNNYTAMNLILSNSITNITQNMFDTCLFLSNLEIPSSVTNIEQNAFTGCTSILKYDFRHHISIPTLSNINVFSGINKFCKIIVPFSLYYDWINSTNWNFYEQYIISTGYVTVNFLGSNLGDIYVNDNLINTTSIQWGGSKISFSCYDSINNILFLQTLTGLTENSTHNINIDLSSYKRLTLSTGVSGLDVTFTIDGKVYNATENNGDYYINIVNSNIEVTYNISGVNYLTKIGTVTITNSDITININYNKIMLSTGVSGLDVIYTLDNITQSTIDDNGDYYLYVTGSGGTLNYFIDGGSDYLDYSGTITTTGTNITENITLTPATPVTWVRPNLTANGTLGGDSFAVAGTNFSSNYPWKAVDSDATGTAWNSSEDGQFAYYTFYNPEKIRVTELSYNSERTTPGIGTSTVTNIAIQGSNDNMHWENIESTLNKDGSYILSSTLNNNKYYKYYKLIFTKNYNVYIYNLGITATTKS